MALRSGRPKVQSVKSEYLAWDRRRNFRLLPTNTHSCSVSFFFCEAADGKLLPSLQATSHSISLRTDERRVFQIADRLQKHCCSWLVLRSDRNAITIIIVPQNLMAWDHRRISDQFTFVFEAFDLTFSFLKRLRGREAATLGHLPFALLWTKTRRAFSRIPKVKVAGRLQKHCC